MYTGRAMLLKHFAHPVQRAQLLPLLKYNKIIKLRTCLCGERIIQRTFSQTSTIATNRDHKRQKAVYETTSPKIILDKISNLDNVDTKDGREVKAVSLRKMIDPYVRLMRLDKPIGIYLLYWPCTWSISLGTISSGIPLTDAAYLLALFGAGSVLMRGAGCTINDMWDKDIDSKVERTRSRPLVTGEVSQRQALGFLALQLSASLAILMQLNWYSVALGASSMALVISYPLAKRYTAFPQLVLGATFNWGALLGYSAVVGHLDWSVCLPLYAGAICWTVFYDTIYAHQDKIDDLTIGIKSTALTFGEYNRAILSVCGVSAAGLVWASTGAGMACVMAAGHALRQVYTLNMDDPADCAKKFRSNTWIGLIILAGIIASGWDTYWENNRKRNERILTESNVGKS